jgi:Bacterial toxin 23
MKHPKSRSYFFSAFLFLLFHTSINAQIDDLSLELRLGLNCNLNNINPKNKRTQKFPGLKVFGSAIFNGTLNRWLMTNYGATVSVYNKSLGNNLNPLVSDIQIDFVNSLSLGMGWQWGKNAFKEPSVRYHKYLRTLNNSPYYSLRHNYENAVFLSTNFILNNHRRHQTVGSFTMTLGDFSVNYYNDSSPPISWFSLGDGFDRYWTGGILFTGHTDKNFNRIELSFDQFTGYKPLLYELSNVLGIKIGDYVDNPSAAQQNGYKKNGTTNSAYNSSAYNLRVYVKDNYALDVGVIGALMSLDRKGRNKERYWSLQDIIHIKGRYSMHANRDVNRFYIGFTYNQKYYEN